MPVKTSLTTIQKRSELRVLGFGAVWAIAYMAALVLLKLELPPWLRATVAIVPLAPFALFLLVSIRVIRNLDELQRRIHLEALALAYPFAIALLMALGLLERAVGLNPNDWSYRHVWPLLALFYFVGLWLAARRYR